MEDTAREQDFVQEIVGILRAHRQDRALADLVSDYHANDIAAALEELTPEERNDIYPLLGTERIAEIFAWIHDPRTYLGELNLRAQAKVIELMDSGDAVNVLEELDDTAQRQIVSLMSREAGDDIRLILSYEDDEIGSRMTNNYIEIRNTLTIDQARKELVRQAGECDNISTIYVSEPSGKFYGAIALKDLIIARDHAELDSVISTSWPWLAAHEKTADCIERIKDYAEDSLPVLDEHHHLLGVITAQDIIEAVDDELGEDYAKLAGLTAEEDLHEGLVDSMKKRLPWLVVLLALGMGVSTAVGAFEGVVAKLSIIICFQSLILDMAGNVGTQSLAVTIRVLMDESLTAGQKMLLVFKEMRVGFSNGLVLGIVSFLCIGGYIAVFKDNPVEHAFLISACVGFSLLVAMIVSSLVGTVVPMFFHKIHVDPAVASGPLITTVNDLVAVVTYYGLAWVLLINTLHLA